MKKRTPKTPTAKPRKVREIELFRAVVHQERPLLEYLQWKWPQLSRNKLKSFLSHQQVLVDGMPVSQFDFMLAKEDVVTILKYGKKGEKTRKLPFPILYEDDEFIVIDKPSGLLSIASDDEREKTAFRLLNDYVRQDDPRKRIFIVHRIDRDTSGVLIVAKNASIRDGLQKSWNDLVVKRGYYAVVEGEMAKPKGTIHTWLKETSTHLMYSTHQKGDGQEAITHYQVMKCNERYSLLDVNIDTGRKNQIRVHLKEEGHPVVGDDKYAKGSSPFERLGLHAYELSFRHPLTKKVMTFTSPIPPEFLALFHHDKSR